MKIALNNLLPNPYRDMSRYPLHREKIESLKASIRSTGFWDNVLVRQAPDNGHFELAYGHHRLEALKELVREEIVSSDYELDVPVRKLDDATMIRIMANENVEEYKVSSEIIDETVRVTREYIQHQTKTPLSDISAADISQFLGGSWNEDRVSSALQRLGLFDRGTIRREQLKGLTHSAARSIAREVGRVEKTMLRGEMERLEEDGEDLTEQERKRARSQVQKVANHVAQVLADHVRNGGGGGEFKEKSILAQADMIPEDAKDEERCLSTIDAAVKAVSAKEFQRKVEMLLKYQEYMSAESRDDLKAKLRDLSTWCKLQLDKIHQ